MNVTATGSPLTIGGSFFVGFLLTVYPLTIEFRWFRPEFIALLLIYWIMVYPQQMGVGFAWCVGLVQDIIEGGTWGGHALALVVVAYFCLLSYRRVRHYPPWKQSFWVFVLVGIHQLFCNWVNSLSGYSAPPEVFLVPALITAFAWPLLVFILDYVRIRF